MNSNDGMDDDDEMENISYNWSLYFPFDQFNPTLVWVDATRLFRQFFKENLDSNFSSSNHDENGRQPESGKHKRILLKNVDIDRVQQVTFDFQEFLRILPESLDGFANVLKDNPATTLACLGLALCSLRRRNRMPNKYRLPMHQHNSNEADDIDENDSRLAPKLQPITPRFINVRPLTPMSQLKSNLIGKFVSVRGNVVKVGGVRPLVRRMDFSCTKCNEIISKDIPDGRFEPPSHCETHNCKSKSFNPIKSSAVTVDFQRIKLQEIIEDDVTVMQTSGGNNNNGEGGDEFTRNNNAFMASGRPANDTGRVPLTVNVELFEDLVDCAVPGDTIVVTGIVKAMNVESLEGKGSRAKGKGRETSLLVLLLDANAVENGSKFNRRGTSVADNNEKAGTAAVQQNVIAVDDQKSDIVANLNVQDLRDIAQLARDPDCFAKLVQSVCPGIFGMEYVKAGLLLGLASGTSSSPGDGSLESNPLGSSTLGDSSSGANDAFSHGKAKIGVRNDSHILVVGDPGLGKSQMLRAVGAVSPRGVYVCGNTASASGLTVTLSKDSGGEVSLEAGALVLADRGVCCIDEFDKMTSQHAALLEAMEQQSISIAKAGAICTLYARTSILAAANPVGGHYNRNKTILENLKISPAMLSRFDLIYILLDRPDERKDDHLARHIVAMHAHQNSSSSITTQSQTSRHSQSGFLSSSLSLGNDMASENESFKHRLANAVANLDGAKLISTNFLRKYIAYAKHYCKPKLSNGACKELQSFYLELREKGKMTDSIPITTRQLESMIRLTLSKAKLELRQVATVQDARDIVSLMRDSLMEAYTDDSGRVDLGRSAGGMSVSKVAKLFVDQLRKAVKRRLNALFTLDELRQEAQNVNLLNNIGSFQEFVDMLRDACYILKKPNGLYELTGAYCGEYSNTQSARLR